MWIEDYKWHYDYVRLAWDTGFSFDKCKSPNLDKNKICVVDIDRIVKERDVATVDRYIATVVQYILDDEQATVLDINFVKIFRLSQLAVDFLLFCKKYLDNTVVLLKGELSKNREENKELKILVNDLQNHIDTITRQTLATFKCSICSKAFSSEEYLNAHIKRRHNNNSESYNVETDKLNMEIKQLKERLNNTEKLLQEKEGQASERHFCGSDNNDSKMDHLLEKFEQFREKVAVELKELKMQKSFYEENYGKLFDIMINSKENIDPKYDNIPKAESTTQTDKLLQIESVHDRNVLEIQEPLSSSNSTAKTKLLDTENYIEETKENLEAKISTTLAGIEGQMQAFWNKLNEIENTKTTTIFQPELKGLDQPEEVINESENIKPKIKPRSILSQPTCNTLRTGNNAENLKLAISKLERDQEKISEHKKTPSKHNSTQADKNTNLICEYHEPRVGNILAESLVEELSGGSQLDQESPLETQMRDSESESLSAPKKEAISASGKKHNKSARELASTKEVLKNLNEEIQEVVFSRILELGISKSWPGIPQRSFEKSLEILNHQAALTKRTYSNFDLLKKKLNGNVEKQCVRKKSGKVKLKTTFEKQKVGKIQNIVKISYRSKPDETTAGQRYLKVPFKRETVEIKNRALYDTDTESENNFKASLSKYIATTSQPHRMYADVVKEFKSLPTVKLQKDQDSDMDDFNKKEDLQKGVLKSFPSVGSLSKKKVLFDLDNESSKSADEPAIQKTGGSTTSVASSILEQSIEDADDLVKYKGDGAIEIKEKTDNTIKEKYLNDLSDFDLSDL